MFNILTSDSAAEDLSDDHKTPWLHLNLQEPGLHLTDQGLEMTSAWSFPIGSTLSVGISCPAQDPAMVDDSAFSPELELAALETEPEEALGVAAPSAPAKAGLQATGIVISCVPSPETEGNYQLTIYFLDHLAQLMMLEEREEALNAELPFIDEPTAAGLLAPPPSQKLAAGKVAHGPATQFFGMSMMPFLMGA